MKITYWEIYGRLSGYHLSYFVFPFVMLRFHFIFIQFLKSLQKRHLRISCMHVIVIIVHVKTVQYCVNKILSSLCVYFPFFNIIKFTNLFRNKFEFLDSLSRPTWRTLRNQPLSLVHVLRSQCFYLDSIRSQLNIIKYQQH